MINEIDTQRTQILVSDAIERYEHYISMLVGKFYSQYGAFRLYRQNHWDSGIASAWVEKIEEGSEDWFKFHSNLSEFSEQEKEVFEQVLKKGSEEYDAKTSIPVEKVKVCKANFSLVSPFFRIWFEERADEQ
jgi:hypothetical protein